MRCVACASQHVSSLLSRGWCSFIDGNSVVTRAQLPFDDPAAAAVTQLELQVFGLTKSQCNPSDGSISVTVSGTSGVDNAEPLVATVSRDEVDFEAICRVSVRQPAAARR